MYPVARWVQLASNRKMVRDNVTNVYQAMLYF